MRRNLPAFLVSVLCALALVFSACDSGGGGGGGGGGGSAPSPSPASLKVPLPSNDSRVADYTSGDAASYLVSISSSKHSDSKSGTPGAVVEFVNIPVGTYAVKVEAKNSNGNTIATATSTATVSGGSSSSVSLKLIPLQYYEVKFNNNGGSGAMPEQRVTVGDKFTLPKCDFTAPEGLKFSQWGIMSNGELLPAGLGGASYELKNDIEFHAIWIDKAAHSIFYENIDPETDTVAEAGATLPESFLETQDVTIPDMKRFGYIFLGWFTDADCTEGNECTGWNPNTYTDDVTLYAKWEEMTLNDLVGYAIENGLSSLTLTHDYTLTESLTIEGSITIDGGDGVTLLRDASFTSASMVNVTSGNVTLKNITIDGKNISTAVNGGGIYVGSTGNLTIENCSVHSCLATKGAGVYLAGGSFVMNSGVIGDSSASAAATSLSYSNKAAFGGGIYNAGGKVQIKGDSKISYNYAAYYSNNGGHGGGIYNEATFTDSVIISESASVQYCFGQSMGGGIYTKAGCVELTGNAKIYTCSAVNPGTGPCGGAVYLKESTFKMTGGKVLNCAGYSCGGVFVGASGTFEMNSGEISGCTTEIYPGSDAVYIKDSTAMLKISGTAKIASGNSIYLGTGASISVSGVISSTSAGKIVCSSYAVGRQVLQAGEGVTLADQIGKFTLADNNYIISSAGKIIKQTYSSSYKTFEGSVADLDRVTFTGDPTTIFDIKITGCTNDKLAQLVGTMAGKNVPFKLILQDTLTTITSDAFNSDITNLQEITIPASVDTIERNAFTSDWNSKTITFVDTTSTWKYNAFNGPYYTESQSVSAIIDMLRGGTSAYILKE